MYTAKHYVDVDGLMSYGAFATTVPQAPETMSARFSAAAELSICRSNWTDSQTVVAQDTQATGHAAESIRLRADNVIE